jgi:hypothetical protein
MINLVIKEKRNYLFAAICSAGASLMIFYNIFSSDLYLMFKDFPWMGLIILFLIIGNIIHGYFSLTSFQALKNNSNLLDIINEKQKFYKSLVVNFLIPYFSLILFFAGMKEFALAFSALTIFLGILILCYYFDLKPILKMKSSFN